jgi:hypothetical protein
VDGGPFEARRVVFRGQSVEALSLRRSARAQLNEVVTDGAIVAQGAGVHLDAVGLILRGDPTAPGQTEWTGLSVIEGATAELRQAFFDRVHGIAVQMGAGSALRLEDSLIRGSGAESTDTAFVTGVNSILDSRLVLSRVRIDELPWYGLVSHGELDATDVLIQNIGADGLRVGAATGRTAILRASRIAIRNSRAFGLLANTTDLLVSDLSIDGVLPSLHEVRGFLGAALVVEGVSTGTVARARIKRTADAIKVQDTSSVALSDVHIIGSPRHPTDTAESARGGVHVRNDAVVTVHRALIEQTESAMRAAQHGTVNASHVRVLASSMYAAECGSDGSLILDTLEVADAEGLGIDVRDRCQFVATDIAISGLLATESACGIRLCDGTAVSSRGMSTAHLSRFSLSDNRNAGIEVGPGDPIVQLQDGRVLGNEIGLMLLDGASDLPALFVRTVYSGNQFDVFDGR